MESTLLFKDVLPSWKGENVNGLLALSMSNPLFTSNIFGGIFCVSLVLYMRFALNNRNNYRVRYHFKRFMHVAIVALVADTLSYGFSAYNFPTATFFNYLTTSLSIIFTAYVGCGWNRFFDVVFHIHSRKRFRSFVMLSFVAVTFALVVANFYNGWLFHITEDNVYTRGKLAFLSFALQYSGFAIVALRAIFHRFNVRTLRYVKLRNSFIWVGAAMLVFGTFQVVGGGEVALQCCGICAGVFIMFCRFQDDQITNDVLTGLNNRYALDTYIEEKFKTYHLGEHSGNKLYLVLMDINYFKKINDEYGHVEGDKALKTVSTALKAIGSKYRSSLFIARYGGDEFAAVFESNSERKVARLCNDIKERLAADTAGFEYKLTVGAGYAPYTGEAMTLDALYNLADAALYEDKDREKGLADHPEQVQNITDK